MRDESHMPFKLLPNSPFKLHTATVHWDWPPGACFTGQKKSLCFVCDSVSLYPIILERDQSCLLHLTAKYGRRGPDGRHHIL